MMNQNNPLKNFLIGTAAGLAVGAVTALLFAPKAGKELRRDIADGTQQAYDSTRKVAGQVTESTAKIARQVGSQTASIAGKAKDTIGSVNPWGKSKEQTDSPQGDNMSVVS
ncbi:YtxH domain-containing protein [Paenibacillus tarimensis]|uniref:YtxH domain-containing protein n=1 Tax=Paenibacillus tarimensis TaxID=416012 RepID=UPI001F23D87D|nr:YtxH domain-containing protein [Paenibacillus tarimensis]MCF2943190.1 YtxH domain-containing protein [Paenibacillus tarimensis]